LVLSGCQDAAHNGLLNNVGFPARFCHFLGLSPEAPIPDAKALWVLGECLRQESLMDQRFTRLLSQIDDAGFTVCKGQIVAAALVPVPRQRNSREDNQKIKEGNRPPEWSDNQRRQLDVEACWTKKHGKSHYGYKNHRSLDAKHKIVRRYAVTATGMHDSQVFDELLDTDNSSRTICAASAYRSQEREDGLCEAGDRSHIHRRGARGQALNAREKEANLKRSPVRVRVEQIFAQHPDRLVRTICQARASIKVGLMNIVYNMRCFAWLAG